MPQRDEASADPEAARTGDAFQRGADARAQGLAQAENPYDMNTDAHTEWTAGWCATFDLDEEDDPASDREKPADDLSGSTSEDGFGPRAAESPRDRTA